MEHTLAIIFTIITLGYFAIPFILTGLSFLIQFYTRGYYPELFTKVFTNTLIKEPLQTGYCEPHHNYDDDALWNFFISWALISVFSAIFLFSIMPLGITGIVGFFVIIAVLIAPRYIIDVAKSLKYNTKTRDSDRLVKLEKEIADLKRRS